MVKTVTEVWIHKSINAPHRENSRQHDREDSHDSAVQHCSERTRKLDKSLSCFSTARGPDRGPCSVDAFPGISHANRVHEDPHVPEPTTANAIISMVVWPAWQDLQLGRRDFNAVWGMHPATTGARVYQADRMLKCNGQQVLF